MLGIILLNLANGGMRITLNKAATDSFADGATRLLLRSREGQLQVKLAKTVEGESTPHVALNLVARQRGGAEATLKDLSMSSESLPAVLAALPQDQERPYLILTSAEGDWFLAQHYEADGDPPRSTPHLRVWWSQTPFAPSPMPDDGYVARIRLAASVVREASRRAGKPSKEIVAARALVKEFEELAWEIIPDLMLPDLDPQEVRRAADTLYALADRVEKRR